MAVWGEGGRTSMLEGLATTLNCIRELVKSSARTKKEPDRFCPACFSKRLEIFYGALVLGGVAGAFVLGVAGGVVFSEALLQPVNTALKVRPNSTTMDSFFIGKRNFYWFTEKHK
jgi:hypothetical protein